MNARDLQLAKRKVNKSKMVRDYLAKHADAKPAEAMKELAKYGITPGFFSNIKVKVNKRALKKRGNTSVEAIIAAADLIHKSGSVEEAQKCVQIAGKVAEIVR